MAFLQGVGSGYYKECGYNEWWNVDTRIDVDGVTTSLLDPPYGRRRWSSSRRSLHLENMNLTELPAGVFDGLENLKEIHLQGNRLRALPEGVFRNLSGLRRLYLQNNGLEELPSSVCAETMWK